jgi:hypothetical protein
MNLFKALLAALLSTPAVLGVNTLCTLVSENGGCYDQGITFMKTLVVNGGSSFVFTSENGDIKGTGYVVQMDNQTVGSRVQGAFLSDGSGSENTYGFPAECTTVSVLQSMQAFFSCNVEFSGTKTVCNAQYSYSTSMDD